MAAQILRLQFFFHWARQRSVLQSGPGADAGRPDARCITGGHCQRLHGRGLENAFSFCGQQGEAGVQRSRSGAVRGGGRAAEFGTGLERRQATADPFGRSIDREKGLRRSDSGVRGTAAARSGKFSLRHRRRRSDGGRTAFADRRTRGRRLRGTGGSRSLSRRSLATSRTRRCLPCPA